MMNRIQKVRSATVVAAALLLSLSACQRSVEPTVAFNGQPSQTVLHSGPVVQQGTIRDPSLPDASSVFAAEEAAEKARAEALALQQASALQPTPVAAPASEVLIATPALEKPATDQSAAAPVSAVDKTKLN